MKDKIGFDTDLIRLRNHSPMYREIKSPLETISFQRTFYDIFNTAYHIREVQTADPLYSHKHMGVCFKYRLLDEFLQEWNLQKQELLEGKITEEEYAEWKLKTADDCGKLQAKKNWRKN